MLAPPSIIPNTAVSPVSTNVQYTQKGFLLQGKSTNGDQEKVAQGKDGINDKRRAKRKKGGKREV